MKHFNFLTALFAFSFLLLFSAQLNAQCTPDSTMLNSGNYPNPLADACKGMAYDETIFFAFPLDTVVVVTVTFDSFKVVGDNLPAGLSYTCNTGDCKWTPSNTQKNSNHMFGCLRITGTPTETFSGNMGLDINGCGTTIIGSQCSTATTNFGFMVDSASTPDFALTATGGSSIMLSDSSMNADTVWYDLGDGNTLGGPGGSHTYAISGDYTVCIYSMNNGCGIDSLCMQTGMLTGIETSRDIQSFQVYPNPSNGNFHMSGVLDSGSPLQVVVRDLLGREVYSSLENVNGNFKIQLDLNNLAQGSYALELISGDQAANRLIIIK